MAIDRDAALKKAEKFLRQGRLDQAIGEYLKVIEEQPRDWSTINAVGDLLVRSGQVESGMNGADEAVGAVSRIKADVARVEEEVNAISAALREQGQASNDIAGRVEQVAQISEQNCRSAEQTAALSRELAGIVVRLRETAARYRV